MVKATGKGRGRPGKSEDEQLAEAIAEVMARVAEAADGEPGQFAADLLELAWEAPHPEISRQFALAALAADPDNSDALLLLADLLPPGSQEQLETLEAAAQVAERVLGREAFEDLAGEFWAAVETRPYMRARLSVANCLRSRGDMAGARQHYEALLELNPNDNQGIRYILIAVLLGLGDLAAGDQLLARYVDDDAAFWTFSAALLAFRRQGAEPASDAALRTAIAGNAYVAEYLLGRRKLPAQPPDYYSPGERSEAQYYVVDNKALWTVTPGALDWLRGMLPKRPAKR